MWMDHSVASGCHSMTDSHEYVRHCFHPKSFCSYHYKWYFGQSHVADDRLESVLDGKTRHVPRIRLDLLEQYFLESDKIHGKEMMDEDLEIHFLSLSLSLILCVREILQ